MSEAPSNAENSSQGYAISFADSGASSRDHFKRAFDLAFCLFVLPVAAVLMVVIAILVRLSSRGPALHWSDRVGQHNLIFRMPKFRTMRIGTPQVATHLLLDPATFLTPVGALLRKTSLDELPQLWSVIKGDLSLVGPRPALFNQDDLVFLRTACGVHKIKPGVTGWAQVNGRDELSIPDKVALDAEYLQKRSFWFDIRVLFLTACKVWKADGISH